MSEKILKQVVRNVSPFQATGRIDSIQGIITVSMPAAIGDLCEIRGRDGRSCLAEVIGFSGRQTQIMPFGNSENLQRGDEVVALNQPMTIPVGTGILGRVINAVGEPIDNLGPLDFAERVAINGAPPAALSRDEITDVFVSGQKAIDGLLTLGRGQRVGLFAGSGVGKSTLLGQIARHANADLNVVVLVGERGREVVPFVEHSLGREGMSKSIVIVATANETALARVRAAESALAMADWFRSRGKNVLLMLDSLTRFAMAQRDLGLMLGEPPTARGYTPSVFQKLAVLLERMGNSDRGSITGIITILVEGDDMNDPIADSARSILDGHIVLTRKLANSGHFPAIDVLASNSRLFLELAEPKHKQAAICIRQILARYDDVVDLVQIGAYQKGVSAQTDLALELHPMVNQFLQQELDVPQAFEQTLEKLYSVVARWTS
ncbi:MAG: FliI/YscN family ATPase [Pirellulaceae bacterium]